MGTNVEALRWNRTYPLWNKSRGTYSTFHSPLFRFCCSSAGRCPNDRLYIKIRRSNTSERRLQSGLCLRTTLWIKEFDVSVKPRCVVPWFCSVWGVVRRCGPQSLQEGGRHKFSGGSQQRRPPSMSLALVALSSNPHALRNAESQHAMGQGST